MQNYLPLTKTNNSADINFIMSRLFLKLKPAAAKIYIGGVKHHKNVVNVLLECDTGSGLAYRGISLEFDFF